MQIRFATKEDFELWQNLRKTLWPHVSDKDCREDFDQYLQDPQKTSILLAETQNKDLTGFLEASIRQDYVEGCKTTPVGYIEGWFVLEKYRRQNVGRKLVEAAENWALQQNCQEMASDCLLENETSLQAHERIGYKVISRSIHFKKWL